MINKIVGTSNLRFLFMVMSFLLPSISSAGELVAIVSAGTYEFDTDQVEEDAVTELRFGYITEDKIRFEVNYIDFGSAEIADALPGIDADQSYELIGVAMGAEGQITDSLGVQGRVGGGQAKLTSSMFNDEDETDESYFYGFGFNWAPGAGSFSVIAELTRFNKLVVHDVDVAQIGLQLKF